MYWHYTPRQYPALQILVFFDKHRHLLLVALGHAVSQVCYNTILGACAVAGDADKACELFKLMRSKHIKPGMVSFNLVIEACARVRNSDGYMATVT